MLVQLLALSPHRKMVAGFKPQVWPFLCGVLPVLPVSVWILVPRTLAHPQKQEIVNGWMRTHSCFQIIHILQVNSFYWFICGFRVSVHR